MVDAPAQTAEHVGVALAAGVDRAVGVGACAPRSERGRDGEARRGQPGRLARDRLGPRRPEAELGAQGARQLVGLVAVEDGVREPPPPLAARAHGARSYAPGARVPSGTHAVRRAVPPRDGPLGARPGRGRAGATSPSRPRRSRRRPPTRRSRRCATRGSPTPRRRSPPGSSDYREVDGRLELDLQPLRWALRLVEGDASGSVSALCVTRDADGRWLAGRRAPWLASWAGRWTLGAGGAVDVGESPVETLARELRGGVVGRARRACAARRSCGCPTSSSCSSARPGCPRGRGRPRRTSTTTSPGGRPTSTPGPPRPTTMLRRMAELVAP